GLRQLRERLLLLTAGDPRAQLELLLLFLREVRGMRGAILLGRAQVADHHVVQRADRLAEAQRIAELAVEEHAVAREVRREGDLRAIGAAVHRALAEVGERDPHALASGKSTSSGMCSPIAPRRVGLAKAARQTDARAAWRSGARTLRSATRRIGNSAPARSGWRATRSAICRSAARLARLPRWTESSVVAHTCSTRPLGSAFSRSLRCRTSTSSTSA